MSEDTVVEPSLDFEWDMTFYNEVPSGKDTMQFLVNYDDVGEITPIPVSLIDALKDEKAAFQEYTGFSSTHIVCWSAEESEAYGNGVASSELDANRRRLRERAKLHAKKCDACAALHYKEDDDEL